jgi:hypothetical protein
MVCFFDTSWRFAAMQQYSRSWSSSRPVADIVQQVHTGEFLNFAAPRNDEPRWLDDVSDPSA